MSVRTLEQNTRSKQLVSNHALNKVYRGSWHDIVTLQIREAVCPTSALIQITREPKLPEI